MLTKHQPGTLRFLAHADCVAPFRWTIPFRAVKIIRSVPVILCLKKSSFERLADCAARCAIRIPAFAPRQALWMLNGIDKYFC